MASVVLMANGAVFDSSYIKSNTCSYSSAARSSFTSARPVTIRKMTPQAVSEVREGDPNRLRKRLQGDLDCIVLTALHSEPVRRYSSVEAFGEDLGRHLENRPVNAREDSLWYRASRFV